MDKNWAKKKKLTTTNRHVSVVQEQNLTEADLELMNVKEAEQKVQNLVILNAWKQQKEKNKQLEADVKKISHQVESLQLQIYTLRQLLDSEKTRVMHVSCDLRRVLSALEECNHGKNVLVKEKDQLKSQLHDMEGRLAGIENEFNNQKNELLTARCEAQTWEKQLEKEREKLSRMKDERKFFIEEVRFKGNLLVWQIRSFEQFSQYFNILQSTQNNPALPWKETIGRIDPESEIFRREDKNIKRQQTVVIAGKSPGKLELKTLQQKLERKTAEKDVRTEELEKSILEKTCFWHEFIEELRRHSRLRHAPKFQ